MSTDATPAPQPIARVCPCWLWAALLVMCGALLLIAVGLAAIGVALMRRATNNPLPEEALAEAQLTMEDFHDAGTA